MLLPFFALASSRSERAAYTFYSPVPVARTVGRFTPSCEAKSASSSGLPTPSCSEQATYTFYLIQFQRLECSVASLLPARQKAPLRLKLHPPHILNEPLTLFYSNSNTPAAPIPPPIHIVTIPNCWLRRFIS